MTNEKEFSILRHTKQTGTSIIELLLSLIISITIGSLAFPSFSTMVSGNALENKAQLLLSNLNYARYYAISHAENVMLCSIANNACGTVNDWNNGWMIFIDENKDKKFNPSSEKLLLKQQTNQKTINNLDYSITFRKHQAYTYFKANGSAWPNGSFKLCSTNHPTTSNAVVLSMSGRARIASAKEAQYRCK